MKILKKVSAVLLNFAIVISAFSNSTATLAFNPNEEIHATWFTTVGCTDWPKTLGTENQKQEIIKNLDILKEAGINLIYFQARCRADAMYPSLNWPWAKWLTGELGKDPEYDPLLFMKEECEKRNITLEAWINPFFVGAGKSFDVKAYLEKLPQTNPLKSHPEWIVKNENDWHMLNPGVPEVRDLVIKEAIYIAQKYQLSIHIDDYFYPYPKDTYFPYKSFPIPKAKYRFKEFEFDDKKEYELYGKGLSLEDFRRKNIDNFIEDLYKSIKNVNPQLTFGVSPFAIWKNEIEDGGCGTDGMESYYRIYADTVKWIKNGWVDYIVPQIYWHIGFEIADYEPLAK